ncbi:hypothetical protein EVAR_70568_1 [Eumeta japonica]|uniref:Uncharacterized protein n=1 Tax=Eumeta variegata TaxID=151549 RepID=A0A4C1SUV8_EUMVA|nr:hypothetical protein EVAR_70568_1 [Eumeta japonica]
MFQKAAATEVLKKKAIEKQDTRRGGPAPCPAAVPCCPQKRPSIVRERTNVNDKLHCNLLKMKGEGQRGGDRERDRPSGSPDFS